MASFPFRPFAVQTRRPGMAQARGGAAAAIPPSLKGSRLPFIPLVEPSALDPLSWPKRWSCTLALMAATRALASYCRLHYVGAPTGPAYQ
jgi:hypothetical protein